MLGLVHDATPLRLIAASGLLVVLSVLTVIDLRVRRLPDIIVLPTLWAGLILNTGHIFTTPADAILGAAAGYSSLWAISRVHALRGTGGAAFGGGDLKLAGMLGAWFGLLAVPAALLVAFVTGTAAVLPCLLSRRVRFGQTIPFGPALAVGGAVVLLAGPDAVWRVLQLEPPF